MTTRAEFLCHVHAPLQNPTAIQTSPTKSTYRLRWRELTEWDFGAEAQAYWDNLDLSEKNALINVAPGYWNFVLEAVSDISPSSFTREPHLSNPFALLYAGPHNRATIGANDEHARLETTVPDSAVGVPDGSFGLNGTLVGVVEIKTFWNITEQTIDEVLQGILCL
jgi:hypothetical protein